MSADAPLLCFYSSAMCESVRSILACTSDYVGGFLLGGLLDVRKWKLPGAEDHALFATVISVPFGREGFVQALRDANVAQVFRAGPILLFDHTLTQAHIQGLPANVHIVANMEVITERLCVDPDQCERLRQVIFENHWPSLLQQPSQEQIALADVRNGFITSFREILGSNFAIAMSMRSQKRKVEKLKLDDDWEKKLKTGQAAQPGEPACIACVNNKATICFIECDHTIMCDDCVRIMWTTPDAPHVCPMCRAEVQHIARPHFL